MKKVTKKIAAIFENKSLLKKIGFTLLILAVYRLLAQIPVPFVNLEALMSQTANIDSGGLGYFLMLLWWTVENFSLIAIWLAPYINASIIIQLLSSVVPHLEELSEQGEAWQKKIQQYTRYLTVIFWFVQGIGMVFFINYLLGGNMIDTSMSNLLLAWFSMCVGGVLLMRLWELITEKGISNGVSILIFASIVSGIVKSVYSNFTATSSVWGMLLFMLVIVVWLILLSVFILKSMKEIPVIYARKGKVQETSVLPIPMNPVGMIPIIFAIAFVSFPYLLSKMLMWASPANMKFDAIAKWIEANLNIYTQNPWYLAILLYFAFIVIFTFFYTLIVFSPDKISDNIQKRGWFVPGIRPGKETSIYINKILMHLCLWWGVGLAVIGVYSYVLNYIPFIKDVAQSLWSLPVVVTGSGVIIIVGVVQELLTKVDTELVMKKYETFDDSKLD